MISFWDAISLDIIQPVTTRSTFLLIIHLIRHLENFEAGNIEHADEILSLVLRLEGLVAAANQPQEHSGVDSFGQSCHSVDHLDNHIKLSSGE